jgi:hypothetical protein
MSTVIEGYIFDGSMQELLETCIEMRERFIEHKIKLIAPFVGPKEPEYKIAEKIEKNTNSGLRCDPFNINAAIVAYPKGRKIYLNVFDPDIQEMVERDTRFKDFSFWNNCDRPDEISAREWRYREKTWDKLLPDSCSVPGARGFTYDFGSLAFSTRYAIAIGIVKRRVKS